MKLCLLPILLLLGLNCGATVSFNPKSNSLYACNAGVRHVTDIGVNGEDAIIAKYDDLSVAEDSPLRRRGNTVSADFSDDFAGLIGGNSFWAAKLTSLSFAFSTEKTGSQYFVDYCYLGPKAASGLAAGQENGIYRLDVQISESSLGQIKYSENSGITAKMYIFCDLAGVGIQKTMDADFTSLTSIGLEKDLITSSSETSLSGQVVQLQKVLNSNVLTPPRACLIRFVFSETKVQSRSNSAISEMTVDTNLEKVNF